MHIRRGGRPRADRPRYDLGTPELIMKRAQMSPSDPTLSSTPLDALLGRNHITSEQYAAAFYFKAIRNIIFGRPHPGAVNLDMGLRHGPEEYEDTQEAELRYRRACRALMARGNRVFKTFEAVVIHDEWPVWLKIKNSKHYEAAQFRTGLDEIVKWYRGK